MNLDLKINLSQTSTGKKGMIKDLTQRVEELERLVKAILLDIPCSHRYPHDEKWVWDDEREGEVMMLICRNCGDRV
jgi:hypothetical protein